MAIPLAGIYRTCFYLSEVMRKILPLLLVVFVAWDVGWALLGVKPLFPWQLQEEYAKHHPDLVLLDVRTQAEFSWFHIPGARNVPFRNVSGKHLKIPKNKNVVVICLTGHRSPLVAWHLQKNGYTNVYNLTWGMAGWEAYKFFSRFFPEPQAPEPEMKKVSGSSQGAPLRTNNDVLGAWRPTLKSLDFMCSALANYFGG
jgi:rhodanese-related sulfurtransferase